MTNNTNKKKRLIKRERVEHQKYPKMTRTTTLLIGRFVRLLRLLNPSRIMTHLKIIMTFLIMIKSLKLMQDLVLATKERISMEGAESEAPEAYPKAIFYLFLSKSKQLYHLFEIVQFLSQLAGKS